MSATDIVRAVAEARGITCLLLRSPNRTKYVAHVRFEAMWLLWRLLEMSTPAIAREVGRKDHTTALYGLAKIQAACRLRPEYETELRAIVSGRGTP